MVGIIALRDHGFIGLAPGGKVMIHTDEDHCWKPM